MPESPPPLPEDDQAAEPGWYPDPHSPDLLRWWDGEAWSETDFKLPGFDGTPWWHPSSLRRRFNPLSRVGSVTNVALCGVLVWTTISSGLARDILDIAPLLAMEAVFVGIAAWIWWRGPIRFGEDD